MKATPNLDFTAIEPTKPSLVSFVAMIRKIYQNLTDVINGKLGFGDGTNRDNIDGSWINVVAPAAPNTDFTVNHNLGRIPVGYWIMIKDRAVDVYTGSVASTKTALTLRATVASAVIRLFVIGLLLSMFVPRSEAQGANHTNIALGSVRLPGNLGVSSPVAQPIPNAVITVCNGATLPSPGTACLGTTLIYSNASLTSVLSNPTNADSNGNYTFFANAGFQYVVSVSGTGFLTYSYVWSAPLLGSSSASFSSLIVSGAATTLNLNDILWVGAGAGSYNTVAAAVTAAGSVNKTIIAIRSTFTGTCPASTIAGTNPNIEFWDFSGTCNPSAPTASYGGTSYNFSDGNVLAYQRSSFGPTSFGGTNAALVTGYFQTAPLNLTVGANGLTVDGISAECDIFGTLTGTLASCAAAEHNTSIQSGGGTVTWAQGILAAAGTFNSPGNCVGTPPCTAVTNMASIRASTLARNGATPTNSYGVYITDQTGKGSSRAYSLAMESKGLLMWSPNSNTGGFDCEDASHITHPCIFVDASGTLNIQSLQAASGAIGSVGGVYLTKSGGSAAFRTSDSQAQFNVTPVPGTAASFALGTNALPWSNICLGTAATNNICTSVAAMAAARTVQVADPGGTVNLQFRSGAATTGDSVKFDANGNLVDSGAPAIGFAAVNVSPITVSVNTSSDQNLMVVTVTAGALNSVSRTLLIQLAGVYSTPAASTTTITHKLKLCTVSGCGSGTVITLASWTTSALGGIQATNNPYNCITNASTQTAGVSAAFESHGNLTIDLSALASAAESVFADNNTATVGTIDSTAQLFLQHTIAFGTASGSNSATDRQMIADTVD